MDFKTECGLMGLSDDEVAIVIVALQDKISELEKAGEPEMARKVDNIRKKIQGRSNEQ